MNLRQLIKLICAILIATILTLAIKSSKVSKLDPVKDIAPHVVPYRLLSKGNGRFATGFHLKYKGNVYILTNKHVCDSNLRVYGHKNIQFGNYVGEIIAIDDIHDLCLVTSNRSDGLELAKEGLKDLDKVTLVGYPRGIGKVIREGHVIESKTIVAPWLPMLIAETQIISTIAYGGNSGSPVVNAKGKVAGVLFAGHRYYHTEAYIVPLIYVQIFLEHHIK
jgi:S1-C subfamily serine protease